MTYNKNIDNIILSQLALIKQANAHNMEAITDQLDYLHEELKIKLKTSQEEKSEMMFCASEDLISSGINRIEEELSRFKELGEDRKILETFLSLLTNSSLTDIKDTSRRYRLRCPGHGSMLRALREVGDWDRKLCNTGYMDSADVLLINDPITGPDVFITKQSFRVAIRFLERTVEIERLKR